jgi:Spy/CpxP family protein refolding chaperone
MLIAALSAPAQQASTASAGAGNAQDNMPSAEQQLKTLTAKLDLTSDQQARMTPILQQLHDATLKLTQDRSLTNEERLDKIRPQRYKARDGMRAILNDDQKQKLDQYLQGPHNEMHGNLTGSPSQPPPPQN